ncbi:unnamed protein product [Parnassius mnemosyne]|uniref:RNA-directed DNA polymerase n=1 Tax=Parnassius mnemosyne TaxID=213953 RepID=A0AAV1LVE5_9NEOP
MTKELQWPKVKQRRDETLRSKIDSIYKGETVNNFIFEDDLLKYRIRDEVLGEQYLVIVPKSFQWSLINAYYSSLKHPGWEKTMAKIRETYWFDRMNTTVREFVDNCIIICRTSKNTSGSLQAQLHPIKKSTVPFEIIHMDITGKLGTLPEQEYVVVTIDAYTKYILLHHANNKNPQSTLAALKQMIHLFGKLIVVDGGREFLGEFKNFCKRFGLVIHSIAPGVSRANGQVERVIGTLKML